MWLAFIPFAAFATAFLVGAIALWYIVKYTKISENYTSAGKSVHLDNPLGTLDIRREVQLDPRLAQIPLYPGARPQNPSSPESVTELRIRGHVLQDISVAYSTSDNAQQVWDFYRQQLPDWQENLDTAQGKELISREGDGVRLVRISNDGERTVIETCLKPPSYPHGFGSGS